MVIGRDFLKNYYEENNDKPVEANTQENCFRMLYKRIKTLPPAP